MATQVHNPQPLGAQRVSQRSRAHKRLRAAILNHQTDLRININYMETIVGDIAKSSDEKVTKHLSEANTAISNLRSCLSTIREKWQIFEIRLESIDET